MAGGNTNVQNMNPMMGQMQMNSLQMPGMNTVCPEQVRSTTGTLATHSTHSHATVYYSKENRYVHSYSSKITTPYSDVGQFFLNKTGGLVG